MAPIRIKSRRRKVQGTRLGILATFVAASALALGAGSGPSAHEDEAPDEIHMAMAVTSSSGGGQGGGTEPDASGEGAPGARGAGGSAPQNGPVDGPPGLQGGREGDQGSGEADGFHPNGENGLLQLADYVRSSGDDTQGDAPGAGLGPTDSEGFGGQGLGEQVQTAPNESQGGSFGGGGGGGFGGGAGGGGSGGGGQGPGAEDGAGPESLPGNPFIDGPAGGVDDKPNPENFPGLLPINALVAPAGEPGCEQTNSCGGDEPETETVCACVETVSIPGNQVTGPIPEPATWLMLIVGFMGMGSVLRAQRRKATLPV